ncbi:MAG: hypothetical protein HONBIEJF_00965 [Fimbriimonadaceae bacterium]|nr:hypothetical protein [Fimbriimonadaceae bacterium]
MVLSTDPIAILINEGYSPNEGTAALEDALTTYALRREKGQIVPLRGYDYGSGRGWIKARIDPVNGLGIRIGMTKAEVERIAGRPTRRLFSKRFKCDELVYHRTTYLRDDRGRVEKTMDGEKLKVRLANYYLFRNGRVFFIEASQDLLNGG